MKPRTARSQQMNEVASETAPTIVEDFEQNANIVVDVTNTSSSSTKKGRTHKANSINNVVAGRITRSKGTKNGPNPCSIK